MKDSTKKTLLLLFPSEFNPNPSLAVSDLPLLLPELSSSGIRSLMHWWRKHQLVTLTKVEGVRVIQATQFGQLALRQAFPGLALNQGPGDYLAPQTAAISHILILRQPPKSDPGFRALRVLLKSYQAILIGRGSYALSGAMAEQLKQYLLKTYPTNVWLIKVANWVLGSYRDLILAQPNLIDGLDAFSGISSQIGELLAKYDAKKGLTDSHKNQWCSLYHRFYLTFCENTGIITYFLSPGQQLPELLRSFQEILTN